MSVEHFLDSNILVYMLDDTNDLKRRRAEQLVQSSIEAGTGCISYQVVQETLNVATQKLGFSAEDARVLLGSVLESLWTVQPSIELFDQGLELRAKYGFSFYDSMIVAAAVQSGCARLYSEDLQHGQRIQSLSVQDPFLEAAESSGSRNY